VGATSRRLPKVWSINPGAGRPASMYSVPPVLRTRLKLWLPPNVWLQGSQSTMTGRRALENGHSCAFACSFEQSMRCVVMTPFGSPVEPDVNSSLAIVSGVTAS
jgi:hypothetical protein